MTIEPGERVAGHRRRRPGSARRSRAPSTRPAARRSCSTVRAARRRARRTRSSTWPTRRAAEAAVRGAWPSGTGGLDAVVTAAGTDACGDLADVDARRLGPRGAWSTCSAPPRSCAPRCPHLERARGRVVTVASTLGLRALPRRDRLLRLKFGVVGFTRALAAEMQRRGRGDAAGARRHADGLLRRPARAVQARARTRSSTTPRDVAAAVRVRAAPARRAARCASWSSPRRRSRPGPERAPAPGAARARAGRPAHRGARRCARCAGRCPGHRAGAGRARRRSRPLAALTGAVDALVDGGAARPLPLGRAAADLARQPARPRARRATGCCSRRAPGG